MQQSREDLSALEPVIPIQVTQQVELAHLVVMLVTRVMNQALVHSVQQQVEVVTDLEVVTIIQVTQQRVLVLVVAM